MTGPRADRPHIPGYGIPESLDDILDWSWARERLEAAKQVEQAQDRRVGDPSEELERALKLTWLELRDESDRAVEEADEDEEG